MHKFRFAPLLFVLSLVLTACPGTNGGGVTGNAPQITSFTANPETITAAGQAVALSWTVTNGVTSLEIDNGVGGVSGTSEVVYPSATTTYTLTASNSSGTTSQSVTVSVGPGVGPTPGPGAEDGLPPTLNTFGVSPTQSGFQSDQGGNIEDANDPRIVRVQPNGTFYAVVSATDPGGIAGVTIVLANSSPPGLKADLAEGQSVGGFTLNGEVSGCVLDGTQTSVTCIYEIAVGNIPNVTALPGVSGEFAYVFRTRVADASGLESDTPPRGYVIVGEGGGTPNPPPGNPPPGNPPPGNPPANRVPNADFTFDQQGDTLTVAFSGARSSDPDGDSLKYAWTFGDGKTATSRDFRNTYAKADKYKVSLKVTDPDGKSDTETKTVTVAGADTPNPPPGNPPPGNPPPPPPGNPPANKPVISSFTASPEEIRKGESSTLSWSVSDATSLEINKGVGTVTGTSTEVKPNKTTKYMLTATNSAGSVTAKTTVTVNEDDGGGGSTGPTKIDSFSATATRVDFGKTVNFNWKLSGATPDDVKLLQVGSNTPVATNLVGKTSVQNHKPSNTARYFLEVTASDGKVLSSSISQVSVAPVIDKFEADPDDVPANGKTTLSWTILGPVTEVTLIGGGVNQTFTSNSGSYEATVTANTTYTLTAKNGPVSNVDTVGVTSGPDVFDFVAKPATVSVGAGVTFTWKVSNLSDGSIKITGPNFTRELTADKRSTTFNNVQANNDGEYTIRVVNASGDDDTAKTTLVVNP